MGDVHFTLGAIPNRYPDLVQRSAVLYPLYPNRARNAHSVDSIREMTSSLIDRWRARIGALTDAGWMQDGAYDQAHTILYARNCRPTFALNRPSTRPCRRRSVCPFCYARWVRDVWVTIDKAFPAPDPSSSGRRMARTRSLDMTVTELRNEPSIEEAEAGDPEYETTYTFPFHLIEREHSFVRDVVSGDYSIADNLACILRDSSRGRASFVSQIDPAAAFLYTTVEPHDDGRKWKFTNRQLFKVPADYEFPDEISQSTNGRVQRFDRPSRRVILRAVARACSYPTEMMIGDAERVAQLLHLRQACRIRTSAMYRGFRDLKYQ